MHVVATSFIPTYSDFFFQELEDNFKKRMAFFGRKLSRFELHKGDFLQHTPDILAANLIFVNNQQHWTETNIHLEKMFQSLTHGTKIISTSSFVAKFRNAKKTRQGKQSMGNVMLYVVVS